MRSTIFIATLVYILILNSCTSERDPITPVASSVGNLSGILIPSNGQVLCRLFIYDINYTLKYKEGLFSPPYDTFDGVQGVMSGSWQYELEQLQGFINNDTITAQRENEQIRIILSPDRSEVKELSISRSNNISEIDLSVPEQMTHNTGFTLIASHLILTGQTDEQKEYSVNGKDVFDHIVHFNWWDEYRYSYGSRCQYTNVRLNNMFHLLECKADSRIYIQITAKQNHSQSPQDHSSIRTMIYNSR